MSYRIVAAAPAPAQPDGASGRLVMGSHEHNHGAEGRRLNARLRSHPKRCPSRPLPAGHRALSTSGGVRRS
jgi:hypothetical protein